jgi:putative FmdB family regulatory protein
LPVYDFICDCGHHFPEYFKMGNEIPSIIECPRCHITSAVRQFPSIHTERDFDCPIVCIHRPVHSDAEARRMMEACPDVEVRIDANEDGTEAAYVPVLRNQRAKAQLYKYLKLDESK